MTDTIEKPDLNEQAIKDANALRSQLEVANASLASATDALLAQIPEHLKGIIPASLSGKELIDWLAQAKSTGIFDRAVPSTDGDAKPTVTPKAPDLTALPVFARMAAGYRK